MERPVFKLHGSLIIDKNKPTIGFVDYGPINSFSHIYGAGRVIRKRLAPHYNIITFGTGCKLDNNYFSFNRAFTKPDSLLRKKDSTDNVSINEMKMHNSFSEYLKDVPELDYLFIVGESYYKLPLNNFVKDSRLSNLYNEFFDYVGDDPEILKLIDETNTYIVENWNQVVSSYAFSTRHYNIFGNLVKFLYNTNRIKKKVVGFIIDPVQYVPFFDKNNIPHSFFYFAEDKRGTRNFEQMDIGQLQHIVFDEEIKKGILFSEEKPQTKNLIFAGTIFQDKGTRSDLWELFLKNIKSEECAYYIPLRKNGIIKKRTKEEVLWENNLKESQFTNLYNEVISHRHYREALTPEELSLHNYEHKYGLVLRCVSFNDSLNFKPILYAYKNIIPLLDFMYDPEYLQIPKNIQDKIVVRNSNDIDERIDYFNKNNDERLQLLTELRKLFKIDKWINNKEDCILNEIRKINLDII